MSATARKQIGADVVAQLFDVRRQKRLLEKEEEVLAEIVGELFGDKEVVVFDKFVITKGTHEREFIDKSKVLKIFGVKGLKSVTGLQEYETIHVKER